MPKAPRSLGSRPDGAQANGASARDRRAFRVGATWWSMFNHLAHVGTQVRKLHGFLQFDLARPGQRNYDFLDDAPRALAHDDDAVGKENCLRDAMRDEDDSLAVALPNPQEFQVHLIASHCIERLN